MKTTVPTIKEGNRRLMRLAVFLEKLPASKFDFSDWKCGTKACALGHAAQMPEFKKLGLKLSRLQCDDYQEPIDTENEMIGSAAACRIFHLTERQAAHLFVDLGDGLIARIGGQQEQPPVTAIDVAKEIRRLVARRRR